MPIAQTPHIQVERKSNIIPGSTGNYLLNAVTEVLMQRRGRALKRVSWKDPQDRSQERIQLERQVDSI